MKNKRLWLSRIFVASLIVFFAWQANGKKNYGTSFFSLEKIFSLELFFSQKIDLEKYLSSVIDEGIAVLKDSRPEIKVVFWPVKDKIVLDKPIKKFNEDEPTVAFYFYEEKENDPLSRLYVSVAFNEKLSKEYFILGNWQKRPSNEELVNYFRREILGRVSNYTTKEYEQNLKNRFKLDHSYEDIRALFSAASVQTVLRFIASNNLNPYSTKEIQNRKFLDALFLEPFFAFANIFGEEYHWVCLRYVLFHKALFLFYLLASSFLLIQFFRLKYFFYFEDQFSSRSSSVNILHFSLFLIKNWKTFFFGSKENVKKMSKEVSFAFEEKIKIKKVKESALKYWTENEAVLVSHLDPEEFNLLNGYYKAIVDDGIHSSQGYTEKYSVFQRLVSEAERFLKKKNKKANDHSAKMFLNEKILASLNGKSEKPKRIVPEGGLRREKVLERAMKLLPKDCQVDLSSWKFKRLENLVLVNEVLSSQDEKCLENFYAENFYNLLYDSGPFMVAIKERDLDTVRQILKIEKEVKNDQPQPSKVISLRLPENLRVVIIGGRDIARTQEDYKNSIMQLGPKDVSFIDESSNNRIGDVSQGANVNRLIILIVSKMSHSVSARFKKVPNVIVVRNTNLILFQEEVVVKYQRLKR